MFGSDSLFSAYLSQVIRIISFADLDFIDTSIRVLDLKRKM